MELQYDDDDDRHDRHHRGLSIDMIIFHCCRYILSKNDENTCMIVIGCRSLGRGIMPVMRMWLLLLTRMAILVSGGSIICNGASDRRSRTSHSDIIIIIKLSLSFGRRTSTSPPGNDNRRGRAGIPKVRMIIGRRGISH